MFAQRGARSWKGLEKRRQLIDPSPPSRRCCAFAMAVPLQRGSLGRSHAASREQEGEERPGVPGAAQGGWSWRGSDGAQRGADGAEGARGGRREVSHLASQTGLVSGILTWVSHFGHS